MQPIITTIKKNTNYSPHSHKDECKDLCTGIFIYGSFFFPHCSFKLGYVPNFLSIETGKTNQNKKQFIAFSFIEIIYNC